MTWRPVVTPALRRQTSAAACQITRPRALSGQYHVSRQNNFGVPIQKIVVLVLWTIINSKELANLVVPGDGKRADIDLVHVVTGDDGTPFLVHR